MTVSTRFRSLKRFSWFVRTLFGSPPLSLRNDSMSNTIFAAFHRLFVTLTWRYFTRFRNASGRLCRSPSKSNARGCATPLSTPEENFCVFFSFFSRLEHIANQTQSSIKPPTDNRTMAGLLKKVSARPRWRLANLRNLLATSKQTEFAILVDWPHRTESQQQPSLHADGDLRKDPPMLGKDAAGGELPQEHRADYQ